jgi:hypothetical protein
MQVRFLPSALLKALQIAGKWEDPGGHPGPSDTNWCYPSASLIAPSVASRGLDRTFTHKLREA